MTLRVPISAFYVIIPIFRAPNCFDPQNNWTTPFHSVIFCFSGDDASAEEKNVEEDELGKWE